MTWTLLDDGDYWSTVTNGLFCFDTQTKEEAEWLCKTLNDYENLKEKLDSLSRSVLCDNYGEC